MYLNYTQKIFFGFLMLLKISSFLGQTNDSLSQHTTDYAIIEHVESRSGFYLFKNCGNQFTYSLRKKKNIISFRAVGGRLIRQTEDSFVVIPTDYKINVLGEVNGKVVYAKQYKIRGEPQPKIRIRSENISGKRLDEKRVNMLKGFIYAEAYFSDKFFKAEFPKDSRYKVTKWKVTLVRGMRPLAVKTFTSPSGNIQAFSSRVSDDCRIIVEVMEVKRRRYDGRLVKVKMPVYIKGFAIESIESNSTLRKVDQK